MTATTDRTRLLWRRASDGRWMTHASLSGLDYDRALAIHRVLDDARLAGRLPLVDALVVRSVDDPDPRWTGTETSGTLGFLFVGRVKGSARIEPVAKRVGNALGLVAREGGWVYGPKGRPIVQGWWAAERRFEWQRKGLLVSYRDPRNDLDSPRYAVNDLLDVTFEGVFGPKHEPVTA